MMTARQTLDAAAKTYRRTYDRLYIASQKAGSADECAEIDRQLAAANATYDAAKAAYAPGRQHVGASCTLDGKPATILGRQNDVATVATLPDGPAYEYAWATVERVMSNGGAFRS